MGVTTNQYVVGQVESVVDEFLLLDPYQTPMVSLIGYGEPIYNTSHEWVEDEMFPMTAKLGADITNVATSLTVSSAEPFRINQLIKIEDEILLITNIAGTTLTVTRGYASTTAAAHTVAASIVEVLFNQGVEGADARENRYKARVPKSNYSQIFDETIKISGTVQEVMQHGVSDEYEKEKLKKQLELALQLEKAIINGVKYTNGDIRMMGGIRQFIQSNLIAVGGALELDKINDGAQKIYEAGGFKTGGRYVLTVGAKQKRALSKITQSQERYTREDTGRGSVAEKVLTDFGEFPILLNPNLKPDELLIVDANRIAIRPLGKRSWFHKFLGDKGDYIQGQIVGEYTLEFMQEKAHARLTGLE